MAETARRKESLSAMRVCRFCLAPGPSLSDIFGTKASGAVPLPLQVMACVAIEVFPSDGMPPTICDLCRHFMDQSYRFKQICKQADEALRHYIAQGDLSSPIEWPEDLIKDLPDYLKNSIAISTDKEPQQPMSKNEKSESTSQKKTPNKRPVGRPRKVPKPESPILTSIDIENGEKGMPRNITVMQRGDEVIINAEDDNESNMDKDEKEEIPTGVYPCQFCERSFPLQQLLDIHVNNNHIRERNFPCVICDRAFFTKYDLQKHEETHSGVKPYKCLICDKSFLRKTFLQRHEKIHTTAIKYLCSQCDNTFLSSEEMAAHIKRRHNKERRFECNLCPKKFAFKQGLERHQFSTHNSDHEFKCDYCSASYSTPSRLMRHVHTHAGVRPYPCKFCPKSFLLSHHYTRHLRMKHLDKKKNGDKTGKSAKSEGVFARQEDCYKCVQCDKTFCTQDELIFHSAVHATQDLTCPLCKEKFLNVDDITIHIKSHIEGEQFMCDWCELVFTTEEKLDMHIDSEHHEAMTGDVYKEINELEEQLNDEAEIGGSQENSSEEEYDEEDVLYVSSQQEEIDTEKMKHEEIEVEVGADGQVVKITDVQITIENDSDHENAGESDPGASDSKTGLKRTYTELKPVKSDDLTKKPTEIIQKQLIHNNSSNIIMKAEEVNKSSDGSSSTSGNKNQLSKITAEKAQEGQSTKLTFSQRMREQSMKRASAASQMKENQENQEKQEPSRMKEKSLMLLEQDIFELKKNAQSGISPENTSGRFLSYKSTLQNRHDQTKTSKDKFMSKFLDDSKVTSTPNEFPKKRRQRKIEKTLSSDDDENSESSIMSDSSEIDPSIRRSTRPNKVKDYAALIRDGSNQKFGSDSEEEEEDRFEDDELEEREYKPPTEAEMKEDDEMLLKSFGTRKRGRPRKNPDEPPKKKFSNYSLQDRKSLLPELEGIDLDALTPEQLEKVLKRPVGRPSKKAMEERAAILGITVEELKKRQQAVKFVGSSGKDSETSRDGSEQKFIEMDNSSESPISRPLISSPGLLKKLPFGTVKTLPPGIKPLPLPAKAGTPPGVCQMKIGDKVVRVQKIVMTKAEVNAITKKGLIEMKDGAMVLKAGVKLPTTADNKEIKKTLLSDEMIDNNKDSAGSSQESVVDSNNSIRKENTPKPTRFATNNSDMEDDD